MKRTGLFVVFFWAAACLSADPAAWKISGLEIVGGGKIFVKGGRIEAVMTYEIPDDFALAGWSVSGYKPEVPTACEKVFKCRENKDPRWSSYSLQGTVWSRDCENVSPGVWRKKISIDTSGWPEGDYKLSVSAFFRMKTNPSIETDVYRQHPLNITIK